MILMIYVNVCRHCPNYYFRMIYVNGGGVCLNRDFIKIYRIGRIVCGDEYHPDNLENPVKIVVQTGCSL
jgi:hypothetical protein